MLEIYYKQVLPVISVQATSISTPHPTPLFNRPSLGTEIKAECTPYQINTLPLSYLHNQDLLLPFVRRVSFYSPR